MESEAKAHVWKFWLLRLSRARAPSTSPAPPHHHPLPHHTSNKSGTRTRTGNQTQGARAGRPGHARAENSPPYASGGGVGESLFCAHSAEDLGPGASSAFNHPAQDEPHCKTKAWGWPGE